MLLWEAVLLIFYLLSLPRTQFEDFAARNGQVRWQELFDGLTRSDAAVEHLFPNSTALQYHCRTLLKCCEDPERTPREYIKFGKEDDKEKRWLNDVLLELFHDFRQKVQGVNLARRLTGSDGEEHCACGRTNEESNTTTPPVTTSLPTSSQGMHPQNAPGEMKEGTQGEPSGTEGEDRRTPATALPPTQSTTNAPGELNRRDGTQGTSGTEEENRRIHATALPPTESTTNVPETTGEQERESDQLEDAVEDPDVQNHPPTQNRPEQSHASLVVQNNDRTQGMQNFYSPAQTGMTTNNYLTNYLNPEGVPNGSQADDEDQTHNGMHTSAAPAFASFLAMQARQKKKKKQQPAKNNIVKKYDTDQNKKDDEDSVS